jgi:hypothetical protein
MGQFFEEGTNGIAILFCDIPSRAINGGSFYAKI